MEVASVSFEPASRYKDVPVEIFIFDRFLKVKHRIMGLVGRRKAWPEIEDQLDAAWLHIKYGDAREGFSLLEDYEHLVLSCPDCWPYPKTHRPFVGNG